MSTILVTGATDGLGRAVATELAARGHAVLVHGRDRSRTEAVAEEVTARGDGGHADQDMAAGVASRA